jgi:glutaminase
LASFGAPEWGVTDSGLPDPSDDRIIDHKMADTLRLADLERHEFDVALERAWLAQRSNRQGHLADYIPELTLVDPDQFGLALATIHGRLHTIGDAEALFTIQSTSKPLTFCLALELAGPEVVASRVGIEPSGDPFNAIVFDPSTHRPFNPMVNAGAIAIAGLLCEQLGSEAYGVVLERFSQAAGRSLTMDEAVFRSESETGHRNRAIAHLLLANGAMNVDPDEALDLYFRQCSIRVTAIDLARIGATFANMGKNPSTGHVTFDLQAVRSTMSIMFTCGMYDYSGHWAYDVGIPAKSGVGGGILGVVNRQIGIGSFSPRLDPKGNSIRGVASFEMLAEEFGLHAFECTNVGSSFVSTLIRQP